LGMMNGPEIVAVSAGGRDGLLTALDAPFFDDEQRVETLFLATLSRYPTEGEKAQIENMVASASPGEARAVTADVLWTLLNTAECAVCP
jgi:hypothetical protein